MKKIFIFVGILFAVTYLDLSTAHADKIRVVATMGTLGDFAGQILGDEADIYVVSKPGRDIHFIQPTPKDVLKVKKADVLIHGGLDLETWRQPLLHAAGNLHFLGSSGRAIDASEGIALLDVPQSLSRIDGDIHVFGNPHYWTDPENSKPMIRTIAAELGRLYPQSAARYQARAQHLIAKITQAEAGWSKALEPYRGLAIVSYHKSWSYFAKRYGFEIAGYIEAKPGIPPTAKHLQALTRMMKEKKVRFVVKETYNEKRAAEKVARETGIPLVTLIQYAGDENTATYIAMMDENVKRIVNALKQ